MKRKERPYVPQSGEQQAEALLAESKKKFEASAKRAATAKAKSDKAAAEDANRKAANSASVPTKTSSGLAIKPLETKNGRRFIHTMPAGEAYWTLHKSSKKPDFTSVFKDARTGKWELSVWGKDAGEVEKNHATLLRLLDPGKSKFDEMASAGHVVDSNSGMYATSFSASDLADIAKHGGIAHKPSNGYGSVAFPTSEAKGRFQAELKQKSEAFQKKYEEEQAASKVAQATAKEKNRSSAHEYAQSVGRTPIGDVQSLQWNKSLQMKKGDVIKIKSGWGLVLDDSATEYISRRDEEEADDRDDFSVRAGHKTYARVVPVEPNEKERGELTADTIRADARTARALASDDDRHRDSYGYKAAVLAESRLDAGEDAMHILNEMRGPKWDTNTMRVREAK